MHIDSDTIKTNNCNPINTSNTKQLLPFPDFLPTRTTLMHVDTVTIQTLLSDCNGMAGAMGESHILKPLSIVLDCTDAQYEANVRLMGQLLWQFSFEPVHSF